MIKKTPGDKSVKKNLIVSLLKPIFFISFIPIQDVYRNKGIEVIKMTDFNYTLPKYYEKKNDDGTITRTEIRWPIYTRG